MEKLINLVKDISDELVSNVVK